MGYPVRLGRPPSATNGDLSVSQFGVPITAYPQYGAAAVTLYDSTGAQITSTNPIPVSSSPSGGPITDRSGTITTGATAQQLAPAKAARRYLLIINPLTAGEQGIAGAETLWINFTTTAIGGQPSIPLEAGQSFVMESGFVSNELISVIAATTGHAWVAKEG